VRKEVVTSALCRDEVALHARTVISA
jgi:hypothetical protein